MAVHSDRGKGEAAHFSGLIQLHIKYMYVFCDEAQAAVLLVLRVVTVTVFSNICSALDKTRRPCIL